jgi:hypothetical protein
VQEVRGPAEYGETAPPVRSALEFRRLEGLSSGMFSFLGEVPGRRRKSGHGRGPHGALPPDGPSLPSPPHAAASRCGRPTGSSPRLSRWQPIRARRRGASRARHRYQPRRPADGRTRRGLPRAVAGRVSASQPSSWADQASVQLSVAVGQRLSRRSEIWRRHNCSRARRAPSANGACSATLELTAGDLGIQPAWRGDRDRNRSHT